MRYYYDDGQPVYHYKVCFNSFSSGTSSHCRSEKLGRNSKVGTTVGRASQPWHKPATLSILVDLFVVVI